MKQKIASKEIETITTKIFSNHSELDYAEDSDITYSKHPTRILVPERFIRKGKSKEDLLQLPDSFIKSLNKKNRQLKNKYPSSEIVRFLQFGKGTLVTNSQLKLISLAEEGADVNILYEKHRGQKPEEYKKQIISFCKTAKKKKAVVLEIESRSIELKIAEAINIGIKDFYIISGMYEKLKRWRELVSYPIKQSKGRSTAILLKRYRSGDNRSYIIPMLDAEVDHIVHGSPASPPEEEDYDILFLDSDGIYKEALKVKDQEVLSAIENCHLNKKYPLSRALAINKANEIAQTRKVHPVIKK